MTAPLAGIKVIEIGSWVAAPAAARTLLEWGAEVTKVEPLNGDGLRGMGNAARIPGVNPVFDVTNYGKRSITLNLAKPEGQQLLYKLAAQADVLITNLPIEAAKKLRVDYDSLREAAPNLIYCAVSGFGIEGPLAKRPSFDGAGYWAASGMAALVSDGYDAPVFPRAAVGDHSTSMSAVAGICAALFERQTTGKGRLVHTSLVANGAWQLSWDYANQAWVGAVAGTPDRRQPSNPLNSFYKTADGRWVTIVALQSQVHWPNICRALGLAHLIDDERFATASARAKNAATLVAELDAAFGALSSDEVAARLDEIGLMWAFINSAGEVLSDPDLKHAILTDASIDGETRTIVRPPVDFGGYERQVEAVVPELGQHTEEVLLEAGYDWEEIIAAKEAGAIL